MSTRTLLYNGHEFYQLQTAYGYSLFAHCSLCKCNVASYVTEAVMDELIDVEHMYRSNDMGLTLEEFAAKMGYGELIWYA